jgi:hypothetical protein
MAGLCDISRLRKQARDELAVLDGRREELVNLLRTLDAEFEAECERLKWRDDLRADDTPHERWVDDVEWSDI